MDQRVRIWSAVVCLAAVTCGIWLWLSSTEKTDDQLAIETYNALDLSIETLEVLLGEELEASDTYSIQTIEGLRPDDTRVGRFEKFLLWNDVLGLSPMNIIFYDTSYPTNYWKIVFPGCVPNACLPLGDKVKFLPSERSEWLKFHSGEQLKKGRRIVLEPEKIGSATYYADIGINFDSRYRVTSAEMRVFRLFVSDLERLRATLNSGGMPERKKIYYRQSIIADSGRADDVLH